MSGIHASATAGPIAVGPNGRHFVDESEHPFFWLGDTQWELPRAFPVADVAYEAGMEYGFDFSSGSTP